MGSSAGQQNPPDGGLAGPAGLACPQIDAVLQLEEAADAVRVHVVGN